MSIDIAMLISLLLIASTIVAIIIIEYYHEIRYGLYVVWEKTLSVLTFKKYLRY